MSYSIKKLGIILISTAFIIGCNSSTEISGLASASIAGSITTQNNNDRVGTSNMIFGNAAGLVYQNNNVLK